MIENENKTSSNQGALWRNTDKNGDTYLGGKLSDGRHIAIFPNKFKKTPAHPDFVISISEENPANQPVSVKRADPFNL